MNPPYKDSETLNVYFQALRGTLHLRSSNSNSLEAALRFRYYLHLFGSGFVCIFASCPYRFVICRIIS